ncbi:hypothetical protein JCM33374_g6023 [Metschnikowia sp. JCM 33374]|nr:hypothetical protein JCM33374_g6023 [Metschnikowia sp. JCM 33374]
MGSENTSSSSILKPLPPVSSREVSSRENRDSKCLCEPHTKPTNLELGPSEDVRDSIQSGSDGIDSDDDYISSGEDEALDSLEAPASRPHQLTYGTSIAEHTAFFEKSLSDALDSVSLDSSLAFQAQLSGSLNDKAQLLAEKQTQLLERMETLKTLYKQYIGENKLGDLEKDIETVTVRLRHLKHGHSKTTLFRKNNSLGVVDQYPIEYNQAKDKVLERATS